MTLPGCALGPMPVMPLCDLSTTWTNISFPGFVPLEGTYVWTKDPYAFSTVFSPVPESASAVIGGTQPSYDTVWYATYPYEGLFSPPSPNSIISYNIVTSELTKIKRPNVVISIAALGITEVLTLEVDSNNNFAVYHVVNGVATQLFTVPGPGCIWASSLEAIYYGNVTNAWNSSPGEQSNIYNSLSCFQYSSGQWNSNAIALNLNVFSIKVGNNVSAAGLTDVAIYALAAPPGGTLGLYVYEPEQLEFIPVSQFAGQEVRMVSASADGSVWTVVSGALWIQTPQGTWSNSGLTVPDNTLVFSAASRYRAYVMLNIVTDNLGLTQPQLVVVNFGITAQPTVPWPGTSSSQEEMYTNISQYLLNVTYAASIRNSYSSIIQDQNNYLQNLANTTWSKFQTWCVSNLSAQWSGTEDDFNFMSKQIQTELSYVGSVNNFFQQLANLLNDINIYAYTPAMNAAYAMVGLAAPNTGSSQDDSTTIFIGEFIVTSLGVIAAAPGVGEIAGIGMAIAAIGGIMSGAFSAMTQSPSSMQPGISLTTLALSYRYVLTEANNWFGSTATTTASSQTTILNDWGKLQAVGALIYNATWTWPASTDASIFTSAEPAFNLWIYQALMPLLWQIFYYPLLGAPPDPQYPTYGAYFYLYACCSIIGDDGSVYPSSDLLNTIFSFSTEEDFYLGYNGWSLISTEINNQT